jgi:MtrB/PioB family decaheme-associated outer membrane protein
MKRHAKHYLLVALSTSITLSLSTLAVAEEPVDPPDTSKWLCKLCPITSGWLGEWDLGGIYVSDPTPKFADYRGLDDDGWYLEAGGDSSYRNESGYYFDFYGRNLGLDSRQLSMRGGKQGSYELHARYSEIPRYLGHGTVTPYAGVGTDTLVLPAAWNSGGQAVFMPANLESKRKTMGAGFSVKFGGAWLLDADFERQSKDGTQKFSGGLFAINGALFPAPIDYTTQIFDLGLQYTADRGQVRLEVMGSDFDNGYPAVTWDNPIPLGFGDEISRSALAPDNQFHQLALTGAFRFSPRFRISGKVALGQAEQDAAFLPYSINPAFADRPLPRESLDGKVETFVYNAAGRLYLRLADRLDLTGQYKVTDRDNQTPSDIYTPVLLEVWNSKPRANRIYSYYREQAWLELRYRPTYQLRLNAGAKRDERERTNQEISDSTEDSFWGEVQYTPWGWLDARIKYTRLTRDTGLHEQQGNYDRAEHPLMRKFNLADRDRRRATLEFDILPTDRLSFNLSYYVTNDDYTESVIGLTEGEEVSINLDINFVVDSDTSIYAFVTRDEIESELAGAGDFEAAPWNAETVDDILTFGLGIDGRFGEKWAYGFNYLYSESDGEILTDSGAGDAPFPVLKTELRNARAYLKYRFSDRWDLGLDAYREKYDSADWTVDGVGPLDVNGLLTLGELSPDYETWVTRIFATVRF